MFRSVATLIMRRTFLLEEAGARDSDLITGKSHGPCCVMGSN